MTGGRFLVRPAKGGVDPATAGHLRDWALLPEPEEGFANRDWAFRTLAGPREHGGRRHSEKQPQVSQFEHGARLRDCWFAATPSTAPDNAQSKCQEVGATDVVAPRAASHPRRGRAATDCASVSGCRVNATAQKKEPGLLPGLDGCVGEGAVSARDPPP